MEDTEDSTTDTSGFTDGERRGLVNLYVTHMLQAIQEDPRVSTPDLMCFLIWAGPWRSAGQILRIFRGRPIFRTAAGRLTAARTAVPRNDLGGLPVSTRIPEGEHTGKTTPADDDFIALWPPQFAGEGLVFPARAFRVGGA